MTETLKRDVRSLAGELIWGGEPIASFLGISPGKFYHLVSKDQLPGVRKIGGSYVASKSALRQAFGAIGEDGGE